MDGVVSFVIRVNGVFGDVGFDDRWVRLCGMGLCGMGLG